MTGKLNIFQRTMHLWNGMYPYNAVHVVKVDQPLNDSRMRQVIQDELVSLGLTGLVFDKKNGTFEYQGGPARIDLKVIQGGMMPHDILRDEMEIQLNTPFMDDGAVNPFRFFLIREENAFHFGLVYFHVVAGAESIILLLRHFINKYLNLDVPGFASPLELYPGGYGTLTPRYFRLLFQKTSQLPILIGDLRKSSKPRYRDYQNQGNGVALFFLASDQLRKLLETGKRWEVTLNDLFLALLLKTLTPFASKRLTAKRRTQMTVGSIVNIRKDLGIDSLKTFGLFLGSFLISHPVPEEISLERLAKDVRQRTRQIKEERLYLGTPFELWVGRFLLSFQSPERRNKFYPKNYPLWGGVTNMNLNSLWEERSQGGRIDYVRAVSTGPITPLVLSITTVGEIINVGLTFKQTVFSSLEIDEFISDFKYAIIKI